MGCISVRKILLATTMIAFGGGSFSAQATVILAGIGTIASDARDLSGLTGTVEDGSPANLAGGFGSAIAYAGNGIYLATPDRGPNNTNYNPAIDNTTSYISRFNEISLGLTYQANGSLAVTPTIQRTQLLTNLAGNFLDGRSDHFNTTNPALNTRFDPEGARVSNDGQSVFVSDEYGGYIRQFDRATGRQIREIPVPASFQVQNPNQSGSVEIANNSSGRLANRGLEGLAITPDGRTLIAIEQSPLIQDHVLNPGSTTRRGTNIRILRIDLQTGTSQQFVYQLADRTLGVSEIIAINDHEFLVDERDGNGGTSAAVKRLYRIDLTGATDVTNVASLPQTGLTGTGITPVSKSLFFDLLPSLTSALGAANVPEKIEGLAFGQDVFNPTTNELLHTLVVTNDNDFISGNDNRFFVYTFNDQDLVGFQAQQLVPEPGSLTIMALGLGLLGRVVRRRLHR